MRRLPGMRRLLSMRRSQNIQKYLQQYQTKSFLGVPRSSDKFSLRLVHFYKGWIVKFLKLFVGGKIFRIVKRKHNEMFQIFVWHRKSCLGQSERLTTWRWPSCFRKTYGLIMLIIKSSFSAWYVCSRKMYSFWYPSPFMTSQLSWAEVDLFLGLEMTISTFQMAEKCESLL